jgi:hypothetical protein
MSMKNSGGSIENLKMEREANFVPLCIGMLQVQKDTKQFETSRGTA